uniref:NADH-ubiquinone oxidoreductase chain 5 n=1 Tax=Cladonema pacificum TaxID=499903 RepID=A0A0S2IB80_9CNID|nr:NADH dehydrogenase subunit 5 [Cladonema pacificum]
MYLLIIFLPLLSFIISTLFGRKLGIKGVSYLPCIILVLTTLISYIIFWDIMNKESIVYFYGWNWFNIGYWSNDFHLVFDYLVSSMLILILTVSSLVHIYSTSYMEGDPHLPRFIGYLSLFTFFMIILVTSSNIVQLFIGWEGVGLCSYLLINFWFTRIQANKSAIKAMVLNKIGDIGVLLSIILIWVILGGWHYYYIFPSLQIIDNNEILSFCGILLLIGVIGKSAQLGLHTWLPDAMEGPTPVSALIHAATMVTAGVFLIIRLSPLFEYTSSCLLLIVIFGSLTAFFSSTIGLTQNDLKKVIAYSTCSQLGYMVLICGFSQYHLSLFHLINHGFFKALLFLSAGSVIHAVMDEQDFRKIGSLQLITPFSYVCILVGSMSLMGLPFLTGFYSKDLIIEMIYGSHIYKFGLWLAILSASITAFYSFRLIFYSFYNPFQGNKSSLKNIHEGITALWFPLLILLILSILGGYFLQFFILKDVNPVILPNIIKFSALIVSILGALIAIILCYQILIRWLFIRFILVQIFYSFTHYAWYFDKIWTYFISIPTMRIGFNQTYKIIDNQLLEFLGPSSIYFFVNKISNKLSYFHQGYIAFYLFIFIIFFIVFYLNI